MKKIVSIKFLSLTPKYLCWARHNYTIRREKTSDIEAIDQVTKAAFASAAYSSGT